MFSPVDNFAVPGMLDCPSTHVSHVLRALFPRFSMVKLKVEHSANGMVLVRRTRRLGYTLHSSTTPPGTSIRTCTKWHSLLAPSIEQWCWIHERTIIIVIVVAMKTNSTTSEQHEINGAINITTIWVIYLLQLHNLDCSQLSLAIGNEALPPIAKFNSDY